MKKTNIKQGKYIVVKKNGNILFAKKANKDMMVESNDDIEVTEKSTLTKAEKAKEK